MEEALRGSGLVGALFFTEGYVWHEYYISFRKLATMLRQTTHKDLHH